MKKQINDLISETEKSLRETQETHLKTIKSCLESSSSPWFKLEMIQTILNEYDTRRYRTHKTQVGDITSPPVSASEVPEAQ